jgi:hypothetical protein
MATIITDNILGWLIVLAIIVYIICKDIDKKR